LVAPSPYMTASRSPGSKRITTKMMIDTPKIVRTPKAARRIRYLCTLVTPGAAPRCLYADRLNGGNHAVCVQPS
jgi:hypothetical protein